MVDPLRHLTPVMFMFRDAILDQALIRHQQIPRSDFRNPIGLYCMRSVIIYYGKVNLTTCT
jgi:hypothetical protein